MSHLLSVTSQRLVARILPLCWQFPASGCKRSALDSSVGWIRDIDRSVEEKIRVHHYKNAAICCSAAFPGTTVSAMRSSFYSLFHASSAAVLRRPKDPLGGVSLQRRRSSLREPLSLAPWWAPEINFPPNEETHHTHPCRALPLAVGKRRNGSNKLAPLWVSETRMNKTISHSNRAYGV